MHQLCRDRGSCNARIKMRETLKSEKKKMKPTNQTENLCSVLSESANLS
ncbi:hypothetical protein KC19_12G149100 [Ceratodon purpureus]|uniref:Uncharacterized protein n=1 Tax=Ceratodon purpureus TaxID=3225 RepID=A0A8T0G789_CERPU|nr:hypothetical protein KC19_12G149100 [Ceratodon purpureus]